jgi:hypothetical protein
MRVPDPDLSRWLSSTARIKRDAQSDVLIVSPNFEREVFASIATQLTGVWFACLF